MNSDKLIQLFKRYALWLALAVSVLASWYVSEEEAPNVEPTNVVRTPNKQTSESGQNAPSPNTNFAVDWKSTAVSSRPVIDVFGSAPLKSTEAISQANELSKQKIEPLEPSQTFNFSYAGQVERNGQQSVFLIDETQKVSVIPVGGVINAQWQLIQLDDNIMTLKHTGTGQSYQFKTRLTE
jgi:hypothetical protein